MDFNSRRLYQMELKFKIILIGDSDVGKTSIFTRYTSPASQSSHDSQNNGEDPEKMNTKVTTVDYKQKNIIIGEDIAKLNIWDTAGQERYRSLVATYFKGTHGICLVFDLTNKKSFISIQQVWMKIILEKAPECIIYLIGNKSDLEHKRQVDQEEIDSFCFTQNINYFEISALKNINISEMFMGLAVKIKQTFFPDEVLLYHGYSEMGQMEQMLCEKSQISDGKTSFKVSFMGQNKRTDHDNKQANNKKFANSNCC